MNFKIKVVDTPKERYDTLDQIPEGSWVLCESGALAYRYPDKHLNKKEGGIFINVSGDAWAIYPNAMIYGVRLLTNITVSVR